MKNKVSIVINDFGAYWEDYSYFWGEDSKYDSKRFECLDAKEKILSYAESDNIYKALLKAYYNAASVCEKLANVRQIKYNQCREFHEYGNVITIRIDRFEDESLSECKESIELYSSEIGYDKASLFGALAECFYKILDNIIQKEQLFSSVRNGIAPYKIVKVNGCEAIEWQLDSYL